MEAVTAPQASRSELASDRATQIVEAMRASVATRGIAASTFDHVAREAGVSRGLMHYYFQTKEKLLVEVVRRECDVRERQLEDAISAAQSAEEVLGALVQAFEEILGEGPAAPVMMFEMLTLAQRHERDRRRAGRARPPHARGLRRRARSQGAGRRPLSA